MPSQKPIKKIIKSTNKELLVYVVRPIPRKYQEIINTIKEGHYKTRYDLNKFFKPGTVSDFIKVGLEQGFIKQNKILVGSRVKAILELVY